MTTNVNDSQGRLQCRRHLLQELRPRPFPPRIAESNLRIACGSPGPRPADLSGWGPVNCVLPCIRACARRCLLPLALTAFPVVSEGAIVITIRDLRKAYGQTRRARRRFPSKCNPGETFGLLGPNGAGKTTTITDPLRARPAGLGGRSRSAAYPPTRPHPAPRLLLGVVPQSVALYEGLTAGENLEFFGHMLRTRRP